MQRRSMRVVIASEYPQARHFLGGIIEREGGGDIVGQAQDTSRALTLVRNIRPDVAFIDCNLPHVAGLDAIPLSRVGGLDAAQTITEEIPNIRVILLNNLDTGILSDRNLSSDATIIYSTGGTGVDISFALQDLRHEVVQPNALVFASVEVKQQEALQQVTKTTDKVIFFGALGFAGGWLLTLTVFLAPIGAPLAVAGAVTVLLGLAGKLTASLLRKTKGRTKGEE